MLVPRRGLRQGQLGGRCKSITRHLPYKRDCRCPRTIEIGEWRSRLDLLLRTNSDEDRWANGLCPDHGEALANLGLDAGEYGNEPNSDLGAAGPAEPSSPVGAAPSPALHKPTYDSHFVFDAGTFDDPQDPGGAQWTITGPDGTSVDVGAYLVAQATAGRQPKKSVGAWAQFLADERGGLEGIDVDYVVAEVLRRTGERLIPKTVANVAELEAAIQEYLDNHNVDPKPFVWTASAVSILEKVRRGRQALESLH